MGHSYVWIWEILSFGHVDGDVNFVGLGSVIWIGKH